MSHEGIIPAPEYCRKHGHEFICAEIHSDKLSALVSLQQAEGWWKLDATLAVVLSKSLPELEAACPVSCQGDVRQVWVTVLALVYLPGGMPHWTAAGMGAGGQEGRVLAGETEPPSWEHTPHPQGGC